MGIQGPMPMAKTPSSCDQETKIAAADAMIDSGAARPKTQTGWHPRNDG